MMQTTLVALLSCVATVSAVSSGAIDICNALSTLYGCTDFKDGLRSQCQEENRIMQWTTKPVINEELFHLWVGEDEENPQTTYTPGEWMTVNLRAKKYDMQYRGLLMYAIDAKDEPEGYPAHTRGDPTKLGKWEFNDRENMFHSHCPRTVCHASGELKPYHTSYQFQAPADFDGEIEFVGLIKTGPANMGEFWYPNKVVLKKATTPPTKPGEKWYKGKLGESCAETCQKLEMTCDASRLTEVQSPADFTSKVNNNVVCNKPPLLRCSDLGLSFGENGFCYYGNAAKCNEYKLPAAKGAPTCDTKSDDAEVGGRLCPCACDGNKGPCFVAPPTPPPPTPPPPTPATQKPVVTPKPVPPGQPAPVCTGKAGGCCLADGSCTSPNTSCKLLGGQATCVRNTICVYGDAGCPCTLGENKCAAQLTCSDAGVCAVAAASSPGGNGGGNDYCADKIGQAGCWCTSAQGCIEANLVPKANADGKCYCAVNLAGAGGSGSGGAVAGLCERGDLGCPCAKGLCKDDGVCKKIGSNTLCLEAESSANSVVVSVLLVAVLAVAQLL